MGLLVPLGEVLKLHQYSIPAMVYSRETLKQPWMSIG